MGENIYGTTGIAAGGEALHREHWFENYISDRLLDLDEGWRVSTDDAGFDAGTALFFDDFAEFFEATAPEKAEKMRSQKGAGWREFLKRKLVRSLQQDGTVSTLRRGFQAAGYQTVMCMAPYPDDDRIEGAREAYHANILRFVHQVHYQTAGTKSLDFALFVNGIPVATGEVKTELTQTVQDAIDEYVRERRPVEPDGGRRNPLLMYKRGAAVHFAVSEDEVWMCTDLGPFPDKSARPRFLPFNMGDHGHAGNPEPPDGGYRTHYLWDYILRRDNWLSIFERFVFEKAERKQDATGRWRDVRTQIFPRYHQFDCERRLLTDIAGRGPGGHYLIEHSAGSGKTETMSWTACDLARLHAADGSKLFSSVVIVTDRLSLDENIKKTISQLSVTTGQVAMVGRDESGRIVGDGSKSGQLVRALEEHREIVVVTIQTFLYAWPGIVRSDELSGRSFAVIVDEAHSSQEGSSATSLKTAFSAAADKMRLGRVAELPDDGDLTDEDAVNAYFKQVQESKFMPVNVSFLAFTATPKGETRTLFGTPTGETDADGNPVMGSFHLYPMRQAIEEGYIIDPLTGFVPLRTVTRIADERGSDELVDERAAKRRVARWRSLHPTNVMEKTKWIVDHFCDNVAALLDGQAKAMVVTSGRPDVVRYKYAMDAYLKSRPDLDRDKVAPALRFKVPGEPLVAFSDKVSGAKCVMDDVDYLRDSPFAMIDRDASYSESSLNPRGTGDVARAFDKPDNRLLIVADKYQTGFDQKKLVALYIDKPLGNAIEIVQTYSRVNRTCPGKDQVFVVDFVNSAERVLEAFRTYDSGARMVDAQDPDVVYRVKRDLDGAGVYSDQDFRTFKEALYSARRSMAAAGDPDACRSALYAAVDDPAYRFRSAMGAARDSYRTWAEIERDARASGDADAAAEASARAGEAQARVSSLMDFRRKLPRFCGVYNLVVQVADLGDPDLEVLYAFAKLLWHRISDRAGEDVDLTGLVLKDYRIAAQRMPEGVQGADLPTVGAGGTARAPKRDTMQRIVERLNRTWGDEGDPLMKARAVNAIADKVEEDGVAATQIANSGNSKEAVLADGRIRSVIMIALMSMAGNELGPLAERAFADPQAIGPLADQVYDLIASGKRYDISALREWAAAQGGGR